MTHPPAAPQPPRGWYIEPYTGRERLWDGQVWGPYRPPKPALAVFSHLGGLVAPVIAPAVLRVAANKDDRFTRHHANEGLNKDIWVAIFALPAYLTYLGLSILGTFSQIRADLDRPANESPTAEVAVLPAETVWSFVAMGVFALISMAGLALGAWGATKAGRRQYFRYPLPFRFVRGSLAGAELEQAQQELDASILAAARAGVTT